MLETKLGLIPLRWVAEHMEYDPPHLFSDRQVSGPFASWYHRHHFLDDGQGGTILRDEVDYEPPLGAMGRLFGGGFIERKLSAMFEFQPRCDPPHRRVARDFSPAAVASGGVRSASACGRVSGARLDGLGARSSGCYDGTS